MTTTSDQERAIQELSAHLKKDLRIVPHAEYNGDDNDSAIIVEWGASAGDGAMIFDNGVIDIGGGSWAIEDPLETWTAEWNAKVR